MFSLRSTTLNITRACNLNCKHCYANAGKASKNELSYEEIKDILQQLYALGVFELEITGGEPFMRTDFLDILKIAYEMDFYVSILTNGTLIDQKEIKFLEKIRTGIRCIQVPLEGLAPTHDFIRGQGAFNKVIKTIKLLKEADLPIRVRMTVTKVSLFDIQPLCELMITLGVERLSLCEFVPLGRGKSKIAELALSKIDKELFKEKVEDVKKSYEGKLHVTGSRYTRTSEIDIMSQDGKVKKSLMCGALRGDWLQIMPEGTVTPCDLIDFYAGNVRIERIFDIWENSLVLKAFRNFDPDKLTGACGSCEYKISCGGCRALAFLFNGDFYAEDPMCFKAGRELAKCS